MQTSTFIIDFDSTLVTCESLDELARLSLADNPNRRDIMQKLENITSRGMAGKIAFDESLHQRLQLFAADRSDLAQLAGYLRTRISPSANATRDWFARNAGRIYVVSGGFEEYIIPVVEQLGVAADHVFANRFLYSDNEITGFDPTRLTSRAGGKAEQVAALGLPRPIVLIGDGYTDYEVKAAGAVDEFWAFTETVDRPQVTAKADRTIASFTEAFSAHALNGR
jgi:D-3-phosphoglycerate dehydrogenase / 2-oxoglutarate reductase